MWQCPKCGRDFKNKNQSHYCNSGEQTIDDYISVQSAEIKPILHKIRNTIKKAAPKAIEKLSYRMPTFWQGENLIHFAAFKNHIGIYPGELSRLPFKKELKEYKTSKGAIQFPLDKPIDYKLISDITKFRVSVVSDKSLSCKKVKNKSAK